MLGETSIHIFLEKVAAKKPLVPTSGSVLALCAACAAALSELVANVTLEKKGYQTVTEEMQKLATLSHQYREQFIHHMDKDAEAFQKVISSFKLPKDIPKEQEIRAYAIQDAFKAAALATLALAKDTLRMLELIVPLMEKGNKNALGDVIAAKGLGKTVIQCSLANVRLNLESITEPSFLAQLSNEIAEIEEKIAFY